MFYVTSGPAISVLSQSKYAPSASQMEALANCLHSTKYNHPLRLAQTFLWVPFSREAKNMFKLEQAAQNRILVFDVSCFLEMGYVVFSGPARA